MLKKGTVTLLHCRTPKRSSLSVHQGFSEKAVVPLSFQGPGPGGISTIGPQYGERGGGALGVPFSETWAWACRHPTGRETPSRPANLLRVPPSRTHDAAPFL